MSLSNLEYQARRDYEDTVRADSKEYRDSLREAYRQLQDGNITEHQMSAIENHLLSIHQHKMIIAEIALKLALVMREEEMNNG